MDRESRIPAHPPAAGGIASTEPQRHILMTPLMAGAGGLLAFLAVVFSVVVLPTTTYNPPPSDNWAPLTDQALEGRAVYLANGCVYCHSGFSRPQDVYNGIYYLYPRVSEPGDYYASAESPNILGSERTGPDLSQEGGNHPDGWHVAHYDNPRNTMPLSIMPVFSFLSEEERDNLIAFNQSQGGKEATLRYAAVSVGNKLMRINGGMMPPEQAFPELVQQLQEQGSFMADGMPMDQSPSGLPWKAVWHMNSFDRGYWLTDNPLPLTQQNLMRGKDIYLRRCSGCHGLQGDGEGPAAEFLMPKPFDFTSEEVNGPGGSSGQMYHRILTAGPGTAMENFGTRLSVQDIWRTVLFLRTIQNGSLDQDLVTVDMYQNWTPPPPMLRYIEEHPIDEQSAGPGPAANLDPFDVAAGWLAPGMVQGDEILVGGKLPMTLERLSDLIRSTYFAHLERAYNEAEARGDQLPPRERVMSVEDLQFHEP